MQITILEMEKSSSQLNLDRVFGLATEQTISAQEKYEKVHALTLLVSFVNIICVASISSVTTC